MSILAGPSIATSEILQEVAAERCSQDAKWGDQRMHPASLWHLILGKEVGEAANAIQEKNADGVRAELIQIAAVGVVTIESIDRQLQQDTPASMWTDKGESPPGSWYVALSKELGDVARAILHHDVPTLRRELIELLTVTATSIESLDRAIDRVEKEQCNGNTD